MAPKRAGGRVRPLRLLLSDRPQRSHYKQERTDKRLRAVHEYAATLCCLGRSHREGATFLVPVRFLGEPGHRRVLRAVSALGSCLWVLAQGE